MRCSVGFAILALPMFGLGSGGAVDPRCASSAGSCDAASLLQSGSGLAAVRLQAEEAAPTIPGAAADAREGTAARQVVEEHAQPAPPVMAPMKLLEALQLKGNSAVPHLTANEAHHHTTAGLLQEKAYMVGLQADARTEVRSRSFQTYKGAVFAFSTVVVSLVLVVAAMSVKQVFGIGCSDDAEEEEDGDVIRRIKKVFGIGFGEAADENSDVIKKDIVKDSATDAVETPTPEPAAEHPKEPAAGSPLDEHRAKMHEAGLTIPEVSTKVSDPIS